MKKQLRNLLRGGVFTALLLAAASVQAQDDVLTASGMNFGSGGYALHSWTSTSTNVTYLAYAMSSTGKDTKGDIQINSSKSACGIASSANPYSRIIDKVVVTLDGGNIRLKMSNTGSASNTGSTSITEASDAEEVTAVVSDKIQTYTPTQDYKFFSITTSGASYINSVEVYYKNQEIGAADVTLTEKSGVTLTVGESKSFTDFLNVSPEGAADALTFTSDGDIINIDAENKTVTGVKEGMATVTASIAESDLYHQASKTFNIEVTAKDTNEYLTDEVTAEKFEGLGGSYAISSYTSTESNVEYTAKAMSKEDALTINTNTTSGGAGSGIFSSKNIDGRIIEKVIVSADKAVIMNMSNTASTIAEADDMKGKKITLPEDAEAVESAQSESPYTFKPSNDFRYFTITSANSVSISKIEVFYKEAANPVILPLGEIKWSYGDVENATVEDNATITVDKWSSIVFTAENAKSMQLGDDEPTTGISLKYTATETAEVTVKAYGVDENNEQTSREVTVTINVTEPEIGTEVDDVVYFINENNEKAQSWDKYAKDEEITWVTAGKREFKTTATVSGSTYPQIYTSVPAGLRMYTTSDNKITVTADKTEKFISLTLYTNNDNATVAPTIDGETLTAETPSEGPQRASSTAKVYNYTFKTPVSQFVLGVTDENNKRLAISKIDTKLGITTGVKSVETESGEAIYYNLQGIRVSHPTKGDIYIMVRGKESRKVML